MRLLCPAKINLHLRVGPRREDGFHSLLSWFCTTGLFDTLILDPSAKPAEGSAISLACDMPDVPNDERNLVVKVAKAWADESRRTNTGAVLPIDFILQKTIPAGAGLGGGSSDGARALLGVNALWKTNRSADFLSGFAGRFGSDLPFFFHGPSSICTGRGEIVRAIARPGPRWVLLILPPIHMPTADVYRRFDAMLLGREDDLMNEPDWSAWSRLNARELLEKLINDLEPSAFAISPALGELRKSCEQMLNRPVRMSGSGSSLFTLYDSRGDAELSAQKLRVDLAQLGRMQIIELAPDFMDDLTTHFAALV